MTDDQMDTYMCYAASVFTQGNLLNISFMDNMLENLDER